MQKREGSIKGECNQARGLWLLLLLSSRCLDTSIRVFTKPQTFHLGCLGAPSSRKHILDVQCCLFLP